ncbi:MAG: DNA double-strand break repair nuclease NurA [Zestosphaera sp.]
MSQLKGDEIYVRSEVVARLKNVMSEYLEKSLKLLPSRNSLHELIRSSEFKKGFIDEYSGLALRRIGVVDGGSNILPLNVGYVGIVSALGILIEDNRVIGRVSSGPEVVPEDPSELHVYDSLDTIKNIVDKIRETLVFEVALKLVSTEELDLLIVDGPLAPYGALAKIVSSSEEEIKAWERYKEAVLRLGRECLKREIKVIGVVKRPRSRYLAMQHGWETYDHVILSSLLRAGEYLPDPPVSLLKLSRFIHEKDVVKILEEFNVSFTYVRFTDLTPPYRIDFRDTREYKDMLAFLYRTRTREGLPAILFKADEEAKITKKLMREVYEDVIREIVARHSGEEFGKLISLLPEYGGI